MQNASVNKLFIFAYFCRLDLDVSKVANESQLLYIQNLCIYSTF